MPRHRWRAGLLVFCNQTGTETVALATFKAAPRASVPRHMKTCKEGLPHQDQARKRPKDSNSQCRGLTRLYSPARPPTCSDDIAAPGSPWLRDMKCTRSKPGQLSTPLLQVATSTHPWLRNSQWNSKKKAAQDLVRPCTSVSTSQGHGNTTAALPFSASPFQRRNGSWACPYTSSDEMAALPALTLPATKWQLLCPPGHGTGKRTTHSQLSTSLLQPPHKPLEPTEKGGSSPQPKSHTLTRHAVQRIANTYVGSSPPTKQPSYRQWKGNVAGPILR